MLNLDDEEIEPLRLALEIAVQAAGERSERNGEYIGPAERCCGFCLKRFAELTERLIRYQKDIAEGNI